jgi:ADP-heptose:LPS heptosyltransferase
MGDRPCQPHKQYGVHCTDCTYYQPVQARILIIKLGAAGDVIRTTPILHRLKKDYPLSYITWLTDYPELLPMQADEKIKFSERSGGWITARTFDICYNLDKDREAISIIERLQCKNKFGFGMDEYGKVRAINQRAVPKFLAGVFDDVSRQNKKSYPQEIFEICGFDYQGEKYLLDNVVSRAWGIDHTRRIVGLNTGCGSRWKSRLWPDKNWISLSRILQEDGNTVLWLGGPDEDQKNVDFQKQSGGIYLGYFPYREFISLIAECDILVTQVTSALHIAIGLQRRIVLMNNIFNSHEFELYGLGEIIGPSKPCGCYYSSECPHDSMSQITPEHVRESTRHQLESI